MQVGDEQHGLEEQSRKKEGEEIVVFRSHSGDVYPDKKIR